MRLLVVALVAVSLAPASTDACTLAGNFNFTVSSDAPAQPAPGRIEDVEIKYAYYEGGGTCPEVGVISIDASPPDGCTWQWQTGCGVRLTVVDGTPFPELPTEPVAENPNIGELDFRVDGDARFAFTLEIRAINKRGDEGPPTTVHLEHDFADDHGCNIGGRPGCLLILAAAGLMRRRRRRP